MGLSKQHHAELNKTGISASRLSELRRQYSGDSVALQQIDVYDGRTEYNEKLLEYGNAIKTGDITKEKELQNWFRKYYPNILKGK